MGAVDIKGLRSRLQQEFGFHSFRPGQIKACRSAMDGRDTLLLMATGSGKSLCYQLPGIELVGVTVIVSPLIALAEDQARQIEQLGRSAVILNSAQAASKIRQARQDIADGKIEFVFTTPERLQQTDLCEQLREVGVDLMVIDEAHCVSQWGHDFRPDYQSLHYVRKRLGDPPILAMTATASNHTVEDICDSLRLADPNIITTGVARWNLRLSVNPCQGAQAKQDKLRSLLAAETHPQMQGATIVYCSTTKQTEQLSQRFASQSNTLYYHGKMKKQDRLKAQLAFMGSANPVMFATNAFGLGIDKPDIRQVIHYNVPGSIEAYYQEVGRAGRDGNPAQCTMLFDHDDLHLQKLLAGGCLDASQLATAHHTLRLGVERWGDADGTVALTQLLEISPQRRGTLKQSLQMLASRGLVSPTGRARWALEVAEVPASVFEQLADRAATRVEDRQVALRQMTSYSETSRCRWDCLLDHFEEELETDCLQCNCDNCHGDLIRPV